MTNDIKQRNDADSPWKAILRSYFPEAIQFFFPTIADLIDWSIPPEFLDKEFQQIAGDAATGRRYADQLVKVYRKHGQPLVLLIHIEIQAKKETNFPERMLIYAIRIFELFQQPATSLAILCDNNAKWRPTQHCLESPGTKIQFDFTAIKLLDYADQWSALEASQNPFAIVVMAHLKAQETRKDDQARKYWKFELVRQLYDRGYNRSEIFNLFTFIDWIIKLPKPLAREFWTELNTYEESRKMPYITSVEKIGFERGVKQGVKQGRQESAEILALKMLEEGATQEFVAKVTGFSITQLQALELAQHAQE
jgi:predicted transposase/invertase (TIGR01784 family)